MQPIPYHKFHITDLDTRYHRVGGRTPAANCKAHLLWLLELKAHQGGSSYVPIHDKEQLEHQLVELCGTNL